MAAIFIIVIVMFAAIGALAYSKVGPIEVTKIADATPGQELRLYGAINSTNVTAFTLIWSGNDWKLESYAPFLLVDPKNSENNITVDVGSCQNFESSARTQSGDTSSIYIDGDRITVIGKVVRNETGVKVLVASSVKDGYDEPTPPWVIVFALAMTSATFGAIFYHIKWKERRTRRRYHEQFIKARADGIRQEKPVEKEELAARYEYTDRGPLMNTLGEPLSVEWEPHQLYLSRRRNNRIGYVVLAVVAIGILACWALFFSNGSEDVSILFIAVGIGLFAGIVMWYFMSGALQSAMPSAFAFTSQGAYFRYASRKAMLIRVESVAWAEIKDIPNADEALAAKGSTRQYTVIKVGATDAWLDLGKDVQKRFIEEWRRHRPGAEVEQENIEKKKEEQEEVVLKETLKNAHIEWITVPSSQQRKGRRGVFRLGIATILAVQSAVCLYFAYMAWSAFFLVLAIILPLAIGLPMYYLDKLVSSFRDSTAVGLSEEGIHFRYGEGKIRKDEKEFIPWDNINKVSPANGNLLQIFPNEMDKDITLSSRLGFYYFSLDANIVQRIVREMDGRYERGHPECIPPSRLPDPLEVFRNAAGNSARTMAALPVIVLATGIMLAPILYYFIGFFGIMISMIVSMVSFFVTIRTTPGNYGRWKAAPESVGFSSAGISLNYGSRPVPAGAVGFLQWDALRKLRRRSEEDKLFTGLGFEDTPASTVLIATKKSGTTWYLGPFDPELLEKILSRAPAS